MKKIIIGARGSKLSLAYVSKVKSLILDTSKDVDAPLCTPPIPPVAKTLIPAISAAIIVEATVVAPSTLLEIK